MTDLLTELHDGIASVPTPLSAGVPASGVLVVDKPEGMTSFGVVSRVRRLLGIKKAGHCGTLDPFATGVLPICLNQATRISDLLTDSQKVYQCVVRFGIETDTLDRTGEVTRTWEGPAPSGERLQEALSSFEGAYVQEVPRYSAVKVQGRRLYDWSRSGVDVDLPKREIQIQSIRLLAYQWPQASIEVHCSKGTYIRQLAADIGRRLDCGAHVAELRRLVSGRFGIDSAVSLDDLAEAAATGRHAWRRKLVPMHSALAHLPSVKIEDEVVLKQVINGQLHALLEMEARGVCEGQDGPVLILAGRNDHLAALWWPELKAGQQRRLRVFGTEP